MIAFRVSPTSYTGDLEREDFDSTAELNGSAFFFVSPYRINLLLLVKKMIHPSDDLLKTSRYAFVGDGENAPEAELTKKCRLLALLFVRHPPENRKLSLRSWEILPLYTQIFDDFCIQEFLGANVRFDSDFSAVSKQ